MNVDSDTSQCDTMKDDVENLIRNSNTYRYLVQQDVYACIEAGGQLSWSLRPLHQQYRLVSVSMKIKEVHLFSSIARDVIIEAKDKAGGRHAILEKPLNKDGTIDWGNG